MSHLQGLEVNEEKDVRKSLKMGHTSSPETLVSYQNTTPGKKKT
jgi:hypothetical protein